MIFLWLNGGGNFLFAGGNFLFVWNPATGEYWKIPQSPNIYHFHRDACIYGLGYDGKNDDYKFVIGVSCDKSRLSTLVEVFSRRWYSWRTMQTPYRFTYAERKPGVLVNEDLYDERKPGILVNGNLHWLAKGESGVCVVYLDTSNDMPSFKEIQLPKIPTLKFITIAVLEVGLCVIADNGDAGLDRVEVWKMQFDGVSESWTKRFVIANEAITKAVMAKYFGLKIMWSFKNGKIVFVDSHNMVLYDPKHESAIERKFNRLAYFTSEGYYLESLVPLNSGTSVETELLDGTTVKVIGRERLE